MRRTVVLFVRAPALGTGKRRLAREIGDVAAVRFERLMIMLLLRRLVAGRRWDLRIAVTPDRARARAKKWRAGVRVRAISVSACCAPYGPVLRDRQSSSALIFLRSAPITSPPRFTCSAITTSYLVRPR